MNNKSFQRLVTYLEIWLTGLLLFYFVSPRFFPELIAKFFDVFSYAIVAFLIVLRWKKFVYVATRDIPLLLLFGMVAISGLWSAFPELTSITFKAMLRTILFGMYLATRYNIKEQIRLLTWVFGITTLCSLIFSLALPSYGIYSNGAWRGIFPYKNHLAVHMVLSAMLFMFAGFNKSKLRWIAWIGLAIATALVFLSLSKGGYVIFVTALYLLPLHKFVKQQYKSRAILLFSALAISTIISLLILTNEKTILVNVLGKDTELNGRTPIWMLCIEQALKRPWLGYGISGFWGSNQSIVIQRTTWAGNHLSIHEFQKFNSHNGYIEIFLQLGFLGLSIYLLNFFNTLFRVIYIWMATATLESFWMFQTLIIMLLYNFSDSGGILSRGTIWIMYVSISLSSAVWLKRIKNNHQLQMNSSQNLANSSL
ncbi:O-antigen ligase family protein [Chlorogloeopsis fritschii PCC 9212]|uniref:Ligase n=1 Tax=Chlorogloeopsis fritschii PCC 6912 TaxID=211165 RepID=A0A3S0XZM1_CHLFR|nr:O-antigen ligase [Chlorogloeopsis fritschii]RUR84596.1 ligase [Chlorogloeopsis fritschii PCC 6912]